MYTVHTASSSGFPTPTSWSHTFVSHNFFLLIEITGENAGHKGREYLEEIRQELLQYYPHTLHDVQLILKSIKDTSVIVIGGLLEKDILYIVIQNSSTVLLKRKGKLVQLLKNTGSLSGKIESTDILFLGSNNYLQQILHSDIQDALSEQSAEAISENLTAKLHRKTQSLSGSLLIVTFVPETKTTPAFLPVVKWRKLHFLPLMRYGNTLIKSIQQKPWGLLIGGLLFLLLASVGVGFWQQKTHQQNTEVDTVISEVSHNYDEAMALIDLNPVRARQLLQEAMERLEIVQKNYQGKPPAELTKYIEKISAGNAFALRQYEVEPATFFDLSLVKPQGEGKQISLYQDVLIVFDEKNQALYRINLSSKASQIIAGGKDVSGVISLVAYGEEVYLLQREGVNHVVSGSIVSLIKADDKWGKTTEIAVFDESLYILDPEKNQIWKYIHEDTGFSATQDYLLFDTQADFKSAKSLKIDGSVWLTRGKDILKFTQGKPDVWQIAGLPEELGTKLSLYLDETTKNLYVWDEEHKRVVVIDKTGVYLAQYHWQKDLEISDFIVSEAARKILLLSRGTIYGIDLK